MMSGISYFKRFRMEIDLNALPPAHLPDGFHWLPWDESLLDLHAEVKFLSFQDEIDSIVFPSLSSLAGCSFLMREISRKAGFRAEATWLVACGTDHCGTVQGVRERSGHGAIQNLGVVPAYRGRGLGRALLLQALHGFVRAGLGRGMLEVTAQNTAAIRLYRRLGFRCRKTLYKAVEVNPALQEAARFEM
jgi:ribosomal protein S18 acetylase RimI-like enzyme